MFSCVAFFCELFDTFCLRNVTAADTFLPIGVGITPSRYKEVPVVIS